MAQEFGTPINPAPMGNVPPPKRNNTTLIIIVVVVVVLLCCCCLALAGVWLWNNGDYYLQGYSFTQPLLSLLV